MEPLETADTTLSAEEVEELDAWDLQETDLAELDRESWLSLRTS
jgi:hypothetical protein